MAYIYCADVWCDDCGEAICRKLQQAGNAPANPHDEYSFYSDEYPKYAADDDESDTPSHCAAGEECFNADVLPSGRQIGALFGRLTTDGYEYVRASHAERPSEVTALWMAYYAVEAEQ